MCTHIYSVGRLTWHNGIIPETEVWVKLGGDKGGNTTKMNFQIVNVLTPNSIYNTCVFCCFAATDSVTNRPGEEAAGHEVEVCFDCDVSAV